MASLSFNLSPTPSSSHSLPSISPKLHSHPTQFPISSNGYLHNISSLCKQGQIQAALNLLAQMDLQNLLIGPQFYGELLQGCLYERDFHTGQQIHSRIIKNGDLYTTNEYIETKLLSFYAKCDRLEIADYLFDRLRVKNVFSWSAIIGLRCRLGFDEEALMGLRDMISCGILADNFVLPNAMKACASLKWTRFGRGVHCYAVKMDLDKCVFVSSSLVDMYGKCGSLDDAKKVFDKMPQRNVVTWNSMIVGYVQSGFHHEAIRTFRKMRLEGIELTKVTLSAFLSACANIGAIEEGKQGHSIAVTSGFELDNMLGSSILNLYCKTGLITDAQLVFSRMKEKDAVAWNLLISSYVQENRAEEAIETCRRMRLENVKFDSVTLSSMLCVFSKMKNAEFGQECHSYCIRNNLQSDSSVACGIMNLYLSCEKIDEARKVFDLIPKKDLTIWNTMLSGYAERGLAGETLRLFYRMQLESVPPNIETWNSVILGFVQKGQIARAKEMFVEMQAAGIAPNRTTLSTLISGLVDNGLEDEAFVMLQEMQAEYGILPDSESIISVISACRDRVLLQRGKVIHGYVVRHGMWVQSPVANALREMYAKFGSLNQGIIVF